PRRASKLLSSGTIIADHGATAPSRNAARRRWFLRLTLSQNYPVAARLLRLRGGGTSGQVPTRSCSPSSTRRPRPIGTPSRAALQPARAAPTGIDAGTRPASRRPLDKRITIELVPTYRGGLASHQGCRLRGTQLRQGASSPSIRSCANQ